MPRRGATLVRHVPVAAHGQLVAATRVYRIEVGDSIVQAQVQEYETHVLIPLSVDLATGGHVRGMLEIDRDTFEHAVEWSRERGLTFVRLAGLAERVMGAGNIFSLDERRILPR